MRNESQINNNQSSVPISQFLNKSRVWNQSNFFVGAKCIQGNDCFQICAHKKCQKPAIVCENRKCKCQLNHDRSQMCTLIYPQNITKRILSKIKKYPQFQSCLQKHFADFISWVSKFQAKIESLLKFIDLSNIQIWFKEISEKKQFKQLTGKKIYELRETFNLTKDRQINFQQVQFKLKKQWGQQSDQFKQKLNQMERLIKKAKDQKFIQQSSYEFLSKVFMPITKSKIIKSKAEQNYFIDLFDKSKLIQKIQLLYRASQHDFEVSKFHELCDGKPNTIVLVKTQLDKIIGAYTPIPWKSTQQQEYAQQRSNSSFMFYLNEKQRFNLTNNFERTVVHVSRNGPIFGNGHDLCIKNRANLNNNSYSKIGVSYTKQQNQWYQKQISWKMFTGGQSNRFRILEWEVFQLTYANKLVQKWQEYD